MSAAIINWEYLIEHDYMKFGCSVNEFEWIDLIPVFDKAAPFNKATLKIVVILRAEPD